MARDRELHAGRNAALREDYERLRATKNGRKPKYTVDYVIDELAKKYWISRRRVEDIIWSKA